MMDDHETLSDARHALVDALRALLKTEIMTDGDFKEARLHATVALQRIDDLLRQPHGHAA